MNDGNVAVVSRRWPAQLLIAGFWLAALLYASTQNPRPDTWQRNYDPLSRTALLSSDFWSYPIERNPGLRLPRIEIELRNADFFDAQHGWAVGDSGIILATVDGGSSWMAQTSKTSTSLHSVHFVDLQHGWAVGEKGTILATIDGGRNWNPQTNTNQSLLNSVHFFDIHRGWAVGEKGTILVTADGGENWKQQANTNQSLLKSVHFVDTHHGWAVGEKGTILVTADGGGTWKPQANTNQSSLNSVHFVDIQDGWAVGEKGTILATADGGRNWKSQPSQISSSLESVCFFGIKHGWAVGDFGKILTTVNSGETWETQASRTSQLLSSVHFVDRQNGWAVGYFGIIVTTNDGGSTWKLQAGQTLQSLNSVYFVDAHSGWAVGDSGTVLTTNNNGATWKEQNSQTSQSLTSVYFFDKVRGWAVGGKGTILATIDGGATWKPQTNKNQSLLNSVHFISPLHGWAVGQGGTILVTLDGGENWSSQTNKNENLLNSVYFVDPLHGWAVGQAGTILATVDGGGNWNPQHGKNIQGSLTSVWFLENDTHHGWAVGENGTILVTTDGGANWDQQASQISCLLKSVHFFDARRGWSVCKSGDILATQNGGNSWNLQNSQTSTPLNSVYFADADNGWAVGESGAIQVTTDGGGSWKFQNSQTSSPLNSVYFVDAQHGWAVGDSRTILESKDGGSSWKPQNSQISSPLNSVYFFDAQHGWAVGDFGTILATTDGGGSWKPQFSKSKQLLFGVYFFDTQHGWAVGDRGTILSTTDGGSSWNPQNSSNSQLLFGVHFVDTQFGWAVGELGTILATTNGGKSWHPQNKDKNQIRSALNSLQFIDKRLGWAVGEEGVILATTDGGDSWHSQTSTTSMPLNGVHFVNKEHGWIVGYAGIVLATADGGATWAPQTSSTLSPLNGVYFYDAEHGWAVGEDGVLLRTRDGGRRWKSTYYINWVRYPAPWFWALSIVLLLLLLLKASVQLLSTLEQINSTDRPSGAFARDRLAAAPRVMALSRLLRNRATRPPLVVAIDGEWGTGKSTLMRLLETELRSWGASTAWFNAWHHQSDEQLLAALLEVIRREVVPSSHRLRFYSRLIWLRLRRYPIRMTLSALATVALISFSGQLLLEMSGRIDISNSLGQQTRLEAIVDALKNFLADGSPKDAANFRLAINHPIENGGSTQNRLKDENEKKDFTPSSTMPKGSIASARVDKTIEQKKLTTSERTLRTRLNDIGEGEPVIVLLVMLLGIVPAILPLVSALNVFPKPSTLKAVRGFIWGRSADKETSYRYRFAADFADVTEALTPYHLHLFIDDLDRCTPESTALLLESINFLVESGKLFVILGVARKTVERNLGLAYSNVAEEIGGKAITAKKKRQDYAKQFLRKLVNLRMQVGEIDDKKTVAFLAAEGNEDSFVRWLDAPIWRVKLDQWTPKLWASAGIIAVLGMGVALGCYLVKPEESHAARAAGTSSVAVALFGKSPANTTDPIIERAAPVLGKGAPIKIRSLSVITRRTPVVPSIIYWLELIPLFIFMSRLIYVYRQGTIYNTIDASDLKWALNVWAPVLRLLQHTPRELRRFENRLRHLIASMSLLRKDDYVLVPRLPEMSGCWTKAWYQRISRSMEWAMFRPDVDGIPGCHVVAMLTMFCGAHDGRIWRRALQEALAVPANSQMESPERDPNALKPLIAALGQLPWIELPNLTKFAEAFQSSVNRHQKESKETKFKLDELAADESKNWDRMLAEYEDLYGRLGISDLPERLKSHKDTFA